MRGLVWKELREWGPPAGAVLFVLSVLWCLADDITTWIVPRQQASFLVLATALVAGFALGFGQLGAESLRGTQGYLAHREGGRAALLRAKVIVGMSLALALAILPPLTGCAWQLFGSLGSLVRPGRGMEHALAGFVALPAYACGLFIALIASNRLIALILALVAGFGCFLYSLWLPLPVFQLSVLAIPSYVLGQVVLGAALLALSWTIFRRGHDRDAVLPFPAQSSSLLFAVLLFVFPLSAILSDVVRTGQQKLFNSCPLVVRSYEGQYSLMERSVYEARTRAQSTETRQVQLPDGMVITEPDPSLVYNPAPPIEIPRRWRLGPLTMDPRKLSNTQRWFWLPVPRAARAGSEARAQCYFDREAGVVRRFLDLPTGAQLRPHGFPREVVLRRPDSKPLSRETVPITDGNQPALLADAGDRTLWTIDSADSSTCLAEISLPDGDRFVGIEPRPVWSPEGWTAEYAGEYVLVGAKGRYQWTAGGFAPEGSPATRPFWRRYVRSEWGEASLASMSVRLRKTDDGGFVGPASEIVWSGRFGPRTGSEQIVAVLLSVVNLGGAPILSAQRLLFGMSESLTQGFLPWLMALPVDTRGMQLLHIVLGLLLGAWTWLRVARRGGERNERILWSTLVTLFGVSALLFLVLLAPRPRVVMQVSKSASQPRKPAAALAPG